MQELEALIQKRTGKKEALIELTDIPNEAALQSAVTKAFIEEGETQISRWNEQRAWLQVSILNKQRTLRLLPRLPHP